MKKKIKEYLEVLATGQRAYPAGSGYSGGWKHAHDDSAEIIEALSVLKIKFTTGNDAPRGGLSGKWIKTRKFDFSKALEKLNSDEELKKTAAKMRAHYRTARGKAEALFGMFEVSASGNFYGDGRKPSRAEHEDGTIPPYTARITASGILQVWTGKNWENLKI